MEAEIIEFAEFNSVMVAILVIVGIEPIELKTCTVIVNVQLVKPFMNGNIHLIKFPSSVAVDPVAGVTLRIFKKVGIDP